MTFVYVPECEAVGLDPAEIGKRARRISNAAKELRKMGVVIFGGSGNGTLRFGRSNPGKGAIVLADLDGVFDGGDGAYSEGGDGLLRGEDA